MRVNSRLTAKQMNTRTSFMTTTAKMSEQNGPLPPVSLTTAICNQSHFLSDCFLYD